nr:AraC family transcriptional regulator [uncultured Cellulosilyticum sp.]
MKKNSELLQEKTPHGNALFPLMVHEISTNPEITERIGCHWHREYEILVITKGKAQFQIEDKMISIQENGILFIKSDHLHSMVAAPGMPLDFYAIVFHLDLLNSHINDATQQKYIDPVNNDTLSFPDYILPEEEWEKQLLEKLNNARRLFDTKQIGYELLIKACLYEIWYLLYMHATQNILQREKQVDYKIVLIKSMITWIQANYTEQISLEKMSAQFHISKGQLCRFFKAMTKMSVIEYIHYYRISKSITLLDSTDKTISEIAFDVGFHNVSYFNKIFKYYIHLTPMAYRKSTLRENSFFHEEMHHVP